MSRTAVVSLSLALLFGAGLTSAQISTTTESVNPFNEFFDRECA